MSASSLRAFRALASASSAIRVRSRSFCLALRAAKRSQAVKSKKSSGRNNGSRELSKWRGMFSILNHGYSAVHQCEIPGWPS